ncbi:hypothetical protein HMPREF1232_0040, partial [Streptococcus pyogenes GA40468]
MHAIYGIGNFSQKETRNCYTRYPNAQFANGIAAVFVSWV